MLVNGKNLALYIDDTLVALSKSCNVDITADMIEVSSLLHGRAKSFIAGKYSWQITTDNLVKVSDEIYYSLSEKLKKGTRVYIRVTMPGSAVQGGYAYVQSLRLSGAVGSMATYSVTLAGDGELV